MGALGRDFVLVRFSFVGRRRYIRVFAEFLLFFKTKFASGREFRIWRACLYYTVCIPVEIFVNLSRKGKCTASLCDNFENFVEVVDGSKILKLRGVSRTFEILKFEFSGLTEILKWERL